MRSLTAAVLWAHGDPEWGAAEEEIWQNTVLSFTHLLRSCAIDADLDLFYGHTAIDWARFGPNAIRDSDYVLIAVSRTWRRAWEGDVEPGKYAGALGEANMLRGLFKEHAQEFLERVIPVLLPGRDESDLPTELKATSPWLRVPTLDAQGTEKLLRRMTGQPAHPKPPLGKFRTLPPRTPATASAEARQPEIEESTESRREIEHQIELAESALADIPAPSTGSGEEPWDQARDSVEARRQALLLELAPTPAGPNAAGPETQRPEIAEPDPPGSLPREPGLDRRQRAVLAAGVLTVVVALGILGFIAGHSGTPSDSRDITPSRSYAEGLSEVRVRLDRIRVKERSRLVSERTPDQQARAAQRLSDVFGRAAQAGRRLGVSPRDKPANDRILSALVLTRDGYAAMARAARRHRAAAFRSAEERVRRAERRVQAALGALRSLGYDIV